MKLRKNTMRMTTVLSLILMLVLLAGCAGGSEPPPSVSQNEASAQASSVPSQSETSTETGSILNEDYPNALPIRNQLAMGTLRLEENSELAITPEQAARLLPYWQALSSVLKSGSGASAEMDALQAQIEKEMTREQLQAIAAMKLSQADMQAAAKALGVNTSFMQSMMSQTLSDDQRATLQAQRAASGQQGPGILLIGQLIELLTERAG